MKRMKFAVMVFFALMFFCFLLTGCKNSTGPTTEPPVPARGKLLILQAYGNAGVGAPAGVSHSFVELYNISDVTVNLNGISLYFANGKTGLDVTTDEPWTSIPLNGEIPPYHSYLILGAKHSEAIAGTTRLMMGDSDGDLNTLTLSLSRRGFKAALIQSTANLTVQNPFSGGSNGKPVPGYIDMVGAVNSPNANPPDRIFGYERSPSRCSASEAVRRIDLNDYDDNSSDFISLRYAASGGITDDELALFSPRNLDAGIWEPCVPPPDITLVDYSKLKINEVSGVGNDTDKFFELFNTGTVDIPLYNCKIYYLATNNPGEAFPPKGTPALAWTGRTTHTIKAKQTFTIKGAKSSVPGGFSTGLTASRMLVITLKEPRDTKIDGCIRAMDAVPYNFTDKSYSRIPNGTGDFYFTDPTPDATNGTSTLWLNKVPQTVPVAPPLITGIVRDFASVTPADTVTVTATISTASASWVSGAVLSYTLGSSTTPTNVSMITDYYDGWSAQLPSGNSEGIKVTYTVIATNTQGESFTAAPQNYTIVSSTVDYTKLVLNEISGNNKYVEIWNKGSSAIPMENVKLQRNDGPSSGGSEWAGTSADSIPAGAYRIITFNNYAPPAGWAGTINTLGTVNSGISSGQILKAALIDPAGKPVDVFIRGNKPAPAWQTTTGVTPDTENSYSRMADNTWAYAAPTPGAVNGTKISEIESPGYLTDQRLDPPVISGLARDKLSVTPSDDVYIYATVTTTGTYIDSVVLNWMLDGVEQTAIPMSPPMYGEDKYNATIFQQDVGANIMYWVYAVNEYGEATYSNPKSYTVVATAPDYSKLVLNEVNGVEKWFEIYNTGNTAINLEGVKAYYDNVTAGYLISWTGKSSDSIPAKGYFVVTTLLTGLSANNADVKLQLRDPGETPLDTYQKTAGFSPAAGSALRDKAHARIPDGTGPWYFLDNSTGTKGLTNGTSTTGCTMFGNE